MPFFQQFGVNPESSRIHFEPDRVLDRLLQHTACAARYVETPGRVDTTPSAESQERSDTRTRYVT